MGATDAWTLFASLDADGDNVISVAAGRRAARHVTDDPRGEEIRMLEIAIPVNHLNMEGFLGYTMYAGSEMVLEETRVLKDFQMGFEPFVFQLSDTVRLTQSDG